MRGITTVLVASWWWALAGCPAVEDTEDTGDESAIYAGFDARAKGDDASAILLVGTVRPAAFDGDRRQFVQKPYHYGPLIRRIEELLLAKAADGSGTGTDPVPARAA